MEGITSEGNEFFVIESGVGVVFKVVGEGFILWNFGLSGGWDIYVRWGVLG